MAATAVVEVVIVEVSTSTNSSSSSYVSVVINAIYIIAVCTGAAVEEISGFA